MMSHPKDLAKFITKLPTRLDPDEHLELVVNGDFVDFLAVKPWESWTADPDVAAAKFLRACDSPFDVVFNALKQHVTEGHRLTILVGNHDIELAYPTVQAALRKRVGAAWPDVVNFVDDGSAWRVGGLLIEHGNRYDPANRNDWERIRAARSRTARGEPAMEAVRVSPGSAIVTHVVNPLKADYPFIDLIQPQGELLALLLLVLEPSLALSFDKLVRALRGARLQAQSRDGKPPRRTYQAAASADRELDPELTALFGDNYRQLYFGTAEPVGVQELVGILGQARKGSLKKYLVTDQPIPQMRLQQLRALLRRLLPPTKVFTPEGDLG
jgi:UDP-2,3-diacylglucosamine pyrophosphatase LpxH